MAQSQTGNVLGGVLLIAGSCLGAGMLGLPIITGLCGYFPSLLSFLLSWAYMTLTALLLVEVNSWHDKRANLLTMVDQALGKWAKKLCWIFYLFLFYSLLVAYISASGSILSSFVKQSLGKDLPPSLFSLFFVLLFGGIIYRGVAKVDFCNRLLMFVKIGAFIGLVLVGVKYIHTSHFLHHNIQKLPASLPILITAFGFHNMIPSLTSYMKGDMKKVRAAILGGSVFTLVVYLIWQTLALGIIPLEGPNGIVHSLKVGKEAAQAIGAILHSSSVALFAELLGFFAILTSFLTQALSVTHFLSDGFKIKKEEKESLAMCAASLIPPLVLALIYPDLFFKALGFAGGICATLLFGMMPTLLVFRGRKEALVLSTVHVRGGNTLLLFVFAFSLYIFIFQLTTMF